MFNMYWKPSPLQSALLSSALFLICIGAYLFVSHQRHQENPSDKIMPTVSKIADGVQRTAFETDRKGEYRLWIDTWASFKRFGISLGLMGFAILLGLYMGLFPVVEALFYRFMLFFDKVPALALLPILFIVFGLGEVSKVSLIVLGVFPTIALDTYLRAKAVPGEQLIKARTLGASNLGITFRVVLPQIMPDVLNTIRLNFKAMVLFLIAGESLAASVGLGYRIFVVRRYIAMDIIIPYVLWMSLLAFTADLLVRLWIKKGYAWHRAH
ncbi:ABC transporter permease subunit [Sulfidibacter corallicola]|uniref:ABC transporter permease subunit n=1 Tax=Sulfidibacter corallicola TaxID=2818388 RepID=A0A8A4TQL6_SULCO|nr:ABC transporter permease subunit [Sulfidibacter corallicola]QTD51850.1 ABC transporter permease subunit [Sulfidibacter corallicola]